MTGGGVRFSTIFIRSYSNRFASLFVSHAHFDQSRSRTSVWSVFFPLVGQSTYLPKFSRILGFTIYTIKIIPSVLGNNRDSFCVFYRKLEKYCGGDPTLVSEEKLLFDTVFDGEFRRWCLNSIRVSQVLWSEEVSIGGPTRGIGGHSKPRRKHTFGRASRDTPKRYFSTNSLTRQSQTCRRTTPNQTSR